MPAETEIEEVLAIYLKNNSKHYCYTGALGNFSAALDPFFFFVEKEIFLIMNWEWGEGHD